MDPDRNRWCDVLARLDRLLASYVAQLTGSERRSMASSVHDGLVEDTEAAHLVERLLAAHASARAPESLPPPGPDDVPGGLARAMRAFELSGSELALIVLALAPELDTRYARLLAYINDHAGRQRPTVGLALDLFGGGALGTAEIKARLDRLIRFSIIELDGDGPLSTRAIRLVPTFWPGLFDTERAPEIGKLASERTQLAELVLEPVVRARAGAVAAALRDGTTRTVIIRGADGSGRDALALALASELGSAALVLEGAALDRDPRAAVREARWYDAVLVVRGGTIAPLEGLTGPLIWIADSEGLEDVIAARPDAVELRLERPALIASRRIWERFLTGTVREDGLELDAVVARFPFSPRRIDAAAKRARSRAGASPITTADLLEACRSLPDRRFDGLADRLTCTSSWDDLIIPEDTRRELELVLAWARGGRVALQEWSVQSTAGRGLACLFHGPPGTGKTMAVQVLAAAIGVDVVRIDLSQVVSKYIGETEKNLGRVFDAAREANVILFFDEADALFGKRTAVKDAHDRNANIETGYLLQRLETHDGLSILATNLRANLDPAFLRRLHVVAEFPLPDPIDRRRIWERALPPPAALDGDIDVELLALRFKLSGAEIRNAVVTAALVAASEARRVGMPHVVRGLLRELRKTGRMIDLDDFGAWRGEALRHAAIPVPPS